MKKHLMNAPFAALSVLVLLAAVCTCQPGTASGGERPVRSPLDSRVDQALREIADLGAEMYNNGDPGGCCRLYEGALVALRPFLDQRPALQRALSDGLTIARRNPKMDERAFLLRDVIEKMRGAVKPAPLVRTPPVAREGTFVLNAAEHDLLDLTNKERAKENLPPLRPNATLFQAARAHSANMANQEKMAHELDGKGPGDRLEAVGYVGFGWGENVAAGQRTPAEAVSAWMNSEGHRANILNPQFNEMGLGIVGNDRGGFYFTQVFGIARR